MGFNLNAAGDGETALPYLISVYKVDPDYKGVAFELAYAYNVLKKGNEAIAILQPAIKKTPNELMLYREMGFAYGFKSDTENSVKWFKQGLDQCTDRQTATKGEFAFNIGMAYKNSGNVDEYKSWMMKAKDWCAPSSDIYKTIVSQGF